MCWSCSVWIRYNISTTLTEGGGIRSNTRKGASTLTEWAGRVRSIASPTPTLSRSPKPKPNPNPNQKGCLNLTPTPIRGSLASGVNSLENFFWPEASCWEREVDILPVLMYLRSGLGLINSV